MGARSAEQSVVLFLDIAVYTIITENNAGQYENSSEIVEMVEKIVPTFHPVGENPGRS